MNADGRPFRLFQSVRPLNPKQSARDALAGFQLAAMNIPQALGYTKIAGMPIVTGFYTLLLPLIAFAAFGSSRYLVVSADSATAAILSGGLVGIAPLGSPRYVELASLVALITAVMLVLARLLKLGFLADFLSQTVLVGFLTGVGFQVGIAVLGEMVGIEVASHRTVLQVIELSRNIALVHWPTLAVSVAVIAVIFLLGRLSKNIPAPLIAVLGAEFASILWNFAGHGIAVVGHVVGGLPHMALPHTNWHEVGMLIGISGSCFVMIVAQSAATARFYASRHHQVLVENDDILGLAAANAAAGLSGTFVVNGSPTQTAMVEGSGGKSQLAQISTALIVALVLLFLTKPLQYLPRCVLGAIVFTIAIRLIKLREMASIRRESPGRVCSRHHHGLGRCSDWRGAGHHRSHGALAAAHRKAHLPAAHGRTGCRWRSVLAAGAAVRGGDDEARPDPLPLRRAPLLRQRRQVRRRGADHRRLARRAQALGGSRRRSHHQSGLHGSTSGATVA